MGAPELMDFLFSPYMLPVWAVLWIATAALIHWFDGKYAPWRDTEHRDPGIAARRAVDDALLDRYFEED